MKIINKLFVIFVIAGFLLCAVSSVLSPVDINDYENRTAEKMPVPTLDSFLSGAFQNDVETAVSDQIPLSSKLKKGYNVLNSLYIIKAVAPYVQAQPDKYIKYKGINFYGDDQLLQNRISLESIQSDLDVKIGNLNAVFKSNPDTDFYVYFIEKDTEINFETGEKTGTTEYLLDRLILPEENKKVFGVENIEQFRNDFYLTDHHWNNRGAYRAYCELLQMLKPTDQPLPAGEEMLISHGYSGSKNVGLGYDFFKEDFYAYKLNYADMVITTGGKELADYGNQQDFFAGKRSNITYPNFYGDDIGEIVFSTGDESKENIMLIGESFDNAILKLVASHYNNTHSIDLRHYQRQNGETFHIGSYIQEHEIDKVLLIGNINFYSFEEFLLEQ